MSDFFTTVQEPKKFRRHMLESSKELLQILREYQKRQDLRERKRKKMEELHYQFDELRDLMNELDEYLPEESLNRLEDLAPEEEPEPEDTEDEHEDHDEPDEREADESEESDESEETPEDAVTKQLQAIEEKLQEL